MSFSWRSIVTSTLIAAGILGGTASTSFGQTDFRPPGSAQADVHNPYSSSYLPMRPDQSAGSQWGTVTAPGANFYSWPYYNTYVYPYVTGYGYYDPWLSGAYDYPYYDRYYGWGPVFVPAETLYGPDAVKRFLGIDQRAGYVEPAESDPPPRERISARDNGDRAKVRVRESNQETKALAGKFIGHGDAAFAKAQYAQALSRYRTAGQTAPDLADALLKQGFTLIALGNYEPAMKSFRRALLLDDDWWNSRFKLDQLYNGQKDIKLDHIEALAETVEVNPQDATLLTLLGLALFFDGQQQRALTFFERAEELGGNDNGELDRFLIARRSAIGADDDVPQINGVKPRAGDVPADRRNPPPPPSPSPSPSPKK